MSSGSQRCSGIAYITGVLQWMVTDSLGSTGWDDEEGRAQEECMKFCIRTND